MKNIPVFLAANEDYAQYCAVTIISVMKNTKSSVDFYILDGGITEKTKNKIKKFVSKLNNATVEFLNLDKYELEKYPNKGHYTVNTYSRYFIPLIKPQMNKIVYIDCDLVVVKDIKKFYDIDMDDMPVVATSEDFFPHNKRKLQTFYPQYSDNSNYFNAGVLLMDIKSFVKNNYTQQLKDAVFKYYDKVNCPSQDIMNIVFENKCKIVDYKYDLMPDLFEDLKKCKNGLIKDDYKKEAVIIHYTAGKPWKNQSCMSLVFMKYALMTPFANQILSCFIKNSVLNIIKPVVKIIRFLICYYN